MSRILDLDATEARKFFLKSESYCNIDLPPYFSFQNLINKISEKIDNKEINELVDSQEKRRPSHYENNNYLLINNKNGKFAWRPLQLIHPVIYVALIHKITQEENWKQIQERFKNFEQNNKVNCFSLPIKSDDNDSDTASSIKNWILNVEQKSIDLSLEFSSILHTDITNCYGSIYTHSIGWALHGKPETKGMDEEKRKSTLGGQIDYLIRCSQYGQTNGIPQGSVIMDFIAELVLGYVDSKLTKKLEEFKGFKYKIIRYRDDYRIFAESQHNLQIVAKNLTEALFDVGMKLNENKTLISDNVILSAIKPDKLEYHIARINDNEENLRNHILAIYQFSLNYPNSGALKKLLRKFYDKILQSKTVFSENISNLISITADIAYHNPSTYPIAFAIISFFLSLLPQQEKDNFLDKIHKKFEKIPNIGYAEIWQQRIAIKTNPKQDYKELLCQKVSCKNVKIWEYEWLLEGELKDLIKKADIIDETIINNMENFITKEEVEVFSSQQFY